MCAAPTARAADPFAREIFANDLLHYPHGVRNIGMGATGTADASGLSTGYFNPASVAFNRVTTVFGSYEDMFASFSMSDFVVSSPIPLDSDSTEGPWRFAGSLGFTYLNYPVQHERTIFLPGGTGRTFDPDAWSLTALGAASWTHGIMSVAGGATARYEAQELGSGTLDMFAFDLGVIAAFPIDMGDGRVRPRIGYAMLNLDTGADYDGRSAHIANESRGGFGFDIEAPRVIVAKKSVPSVTFSLDYDQIDSQGRSPIDFCSGVELSIVDMIHLRYGAIDSDYNTYGIGAGWDYGHVLFRLDYAHVDLRSRSFFDLDLDRDTFGALVGVRW
jgi:hypothetical protein